MAKGYAKEQVGVRDGTLVPAIKADGRVVHSRKRCVRATFDLSQATVARASGDTNVIGVLPKGHRFAGLRFTTSATLGTSTVSVGTAASAAAYKTAAVFTAVDTPTWYGLATAIAADPVETDTEILLTVGTATLPSSGILVVDLFYTGR